MENEQLLLRLKKLSKKDLELLTLLFVDGYRQIDEHVFGIVPEVLLHKDLKK